MGVVIKVLHILVTIVTEFVVPSPPKPPAGDDDGELQDCRFAVGKGSRPQRPGQPRDSAGPRRGPNRVPGHSASSGGVWRFGEPPGPQRRPAHPHCHQGRPPGCRGVPGTAL